MKKARIHKDRLLRVVFLVSVLIPGITLHVRAQKNKDIAPARKGRSQIVDDSTKNVYGPRTALSTTEKSLFLNQNKYVPLDTSIINYHRWTYVQRFNNYYKDLGNNGTALSPIFPTLSSTVGVTSGFTCYDPYFQTEEPRYFNTKSPFTRIYVVWGGNGRATTRIEFSRNITPRWNFGFDYRPILSDKQIQYRKADRQTISHYYDFYTTYKSKDDRYFLLFNYRRIRHRIVENGGVHVKDGDSYLKFFDREAAINLTSAETELKRSTLHLFQQYQLARPAQVYLTLDYSTQLNKFSDKTSQEVNRATFFDYFRGDSTNATDRAKLNIFQSEAGTKGNAGPLFYNFYYKTRSYQYENHYLAKTTGDVMAYTKTGTERYVGGTMALTFDSLTELSGVAEYLLDGNYKLEAFWKSPWIDASGRSSLSKPGLMQQVYYGSHDAWSNSFSDISALQVNGFLKAQLGPLFISPGATFSTFSNYVYFREKVDASAFQRVLPYQSHGSQTIFSPEVRMTLRFFRHFYLRPQVIYTSFLKNDDNAFQIPTLFFNGQLAYENALVKGNLIVQIGVDGHWKSDYHALGYDPAIQQFYVQERATATRFLLADIFFNAKLKRGKFFFKYHNLVQAFTKIGYVPTPTYQGQHNLLDFGFELLLFD